MYDPQDLDNYREEEIDEEDVQLAEEESNIAMNQRRDEIAESMWNSYCQAIGRAP